MTRKWAVTSNKGMLFACGLLVGLIFLFLVPRQTTGRLQLAYAHVFRWPLAIGRGVLRTQATTTTRNVSSQEYEDLLQVNQQLRNKSANVEAALQEANRQIELLTKLKARPGLEHMQPIPAKVYTQVGDEMTISRGQASGVAVGQYVLSLTEARIEGQCVIGVVSVVSAKGAKVKLITDPTSKLPVNIAGLDAGKFLCGRGDNEAKIPYVLREHTIHVGDVVYAQAQRGLLDVPVIVAEVTQCERDVDYPNMWNITARPVCDLTTLTDVAVLKRTSAP
jgi:cell shape-determining protein MreC